MVFRPRSQSDRSNPLAEQGETEGILRHLLERGDVNVVYFGQWKGDPIPGVTVIQSQIDGLNENSSRGFQQEGWDADAANLSQFDIAGFIHVAGYSAGLSMVESPRGTSVQCAAVRYSGPCIAAVAAIQKPRVVVVNDLRSYPREQELSMAEYGDLDESWKWLRPAAILDQTSSSATFRLLNLAWERRSIWARAESWSYLEPQIESLRTAPAVIIAHCHFKTGFHQKTRQDAWHEVLRPARMLGRGLPDLGVYGVGWEEYDEYDPAYMHGPLSPRGCLEKLSGAFTCPMIAPGREYYSNKFYVAVSQGCVPVLCGSIGSVHECDPLAYFLNADDKSRVRGEGDLTRAVNHVGRNYKEYIDLWRSMTKPKWRKFNQCIDGLLAGADVGSEEWFQEFGGYRRA